jgi:hypothetical protein
MSCDTKSEVIPTPLDSITYSRKNVLVYLAKIRKMVVDAADKMEAENKQIISDHRCDREAFVEVAREYVEAYNVEYIAILKHCKKARKYAKTNKLNIDKHKPARFDRDKQRFIYDHSFSCFVSDADFRAFLEKKGVAYAPYAATVRRFVKWEYLKITGENSHLPPLEYIDRFTEYLAVLTDDTFTNYQLPVGRLGVFHMSFKNEEVDVRIEA